MAGQPKTPFFLAVALVVAGLVGFAVYRSDIFAPGGNGGAGGQVGGGDDSGPGELAFGEEPNAAGITTVDEYEFVPKQKLTPITGASDYKPLQDNTVRFALNVWAGWAPIIWANGGHLAKKVWKSPDGKDFKVELVLIDDPTIMRTSYVSGDIHIGWATLDMLPLFMETIVDNAGKPTDNRVMPRIYQQIDWSNGGDGIVVRGDVKEVKDLRGKTIALAQHSPSQYFLLSMLVNAGVQPSEFKARYLPDAFQAAAAFNSSNTIDACVSWAPDIYRLESIKGNRLLVSSSTANRLIADVWFARADFARDNPGICEGLVRGIFDAMEELKSDDTKKKCAKLMADYYNIDETETMEMFADAYNTGWGDNYQFFINKNYLANFERVWNNAYYLYKRSGEIGRPRVSFDQVMDFSILKKLGEEEKYASQKPAQATFEFRNITAQEVSEKAFLTATHYIHFFPNNANLHKTITRKDDDGKEVEEAYDPNVDFIIEKIGEQIGQFELSRIVIEGHTDSSMRNQVDETLVMELSRKRADSVREELVKKFDLDPNRFAVMGVGWKRPADDDDLNNHAKNRRVEVRILPAEGQ